MAAGRLYLIDTFGLIFRAYHARARTGAPAMRTRSGLSTEAVYIFNSMLLSDSGRLLPSGRPFAPNPLELLPNLPRLFSDL